MRLKFCELFKITVPDNEFDFTIKVRSGRKLISRKANTPEAK